MQYQYIVILRRSDEKQIDRISILACLFSILSFIFEQIVFRRFNYWLSFAALAISGGIILNLLVQKKEGKQARFKVWLAIAGIVWFQMPWLQWLSIGYFLLAFLEYQAKYPLEVGFSSNLVVVNSIFKKRFQWDAFNNIILKDGILTLDFKSNRLFQKETIDDEQPDADEDEFNAFCQQQLLRSANEAAAK